MTDWVLAIEGTPRAATVASMLALLSAVAHAVFGALQKGRHDPWLTRGAIDICYFALALPVALFLVPRPDATLWLLLGGAFLIHTAYKILMAAAYARAPYTVVYPIVRGTGPLVTVMAAGVIFGESYAAGQWLGVLMLSVGILSLSAFNLSRVSVDRGRLWSAMFIAFACGITVAAYTTYDAIGMRAAPDPFTFLVWFFVIDGLFMPMLAVWKWRRLDARPTLAPLMLRGVIGALIAYVSFGAVMLATRLDKVGEAAVLRETSVVFAALIGWAFLGETVGVRRTLMMGVIALGAVLVEIAG
ncbi:DMT family transporter [Oceanomicrobium pacificus]|uniref:EamA family transporter n=1 Tax=Oceanomicrobium pacificus TaxID=2692916 RepID=A0A6B0TLY0_9RHOB|nr:DMT family transporter [Oceanomicrobium pacificus]MXU65547.1 EamA family transporter [Oceanomicrobium pacificus]